MSTIPPSRRAEKFQIPRQRLGHDQTEGFLRRKMDQTARVVATAEPIRSWTFHRNRTRNRRRSAA